MTFFWLSRTTKPCQNGIIFYRKEFAPRGGANSSVYELNPIEKGDNDEIVEFLHLKVYPFILMLHKTILYCSTLELSQ